MIDHGRPADPDRLYAYHCGQVDGLWEALRVVGTRHGVEKLGWMLKVARALADDAANGQIPA